MKNISEKNTPIEESMHTQFTLLRTSKIDSLDITVEEYEHNIIGCKHYHLDAKCSENVFLVALRTVPMDSKGVAHILEHTVLCGSENYPVRDPFFMMTRRSLNTFMNAFTSSDWTAYPFASKNKKDLFNLMDVYVDAVFFANLNKLDFSQEGHRLEISESEKTESELVYKGVVYNEMKGAMSSPVNTLWNNLTKHLFPTTTYHFNSGGDPECITDLTYDELVSFYKIHYHPGNSIIMTFGDIPASVYQQKMEEKVLSKFDKLDTEIKVKNEVRYLSQQNVVESYAIDDEDISAKTHIVMGWLLGDNTDLYGVLSAHLLSGVLLNNGSSPLRYALESTDLGNSPSPLCGVEDSSKEIIFACGLEGSTPESAEKTEHLILGVLNDVFDNGVSYDEVESVLLQLELQQREITGDSYPYGLHLMLDALPYAIHRGDPVSALNLDPVLARLRNDIKNPDFIKTLVKDLLLDNQHRIRLVMNPDKSLGASRDKKEKEKLGLIRNSLNQEQLDNIIKTANDLEERQSIPDNPELLPKVEISDIPREMIFPVEVVENINDRKITYYNQGTNGIVYQQLIYQIPDLGNELINALPFYSTCLSELGIGKMDYLETQALQAKISGGINAYSSIRNGIDNINDIKAYFTLSGKALYQNNTQLADLLCNTMDSIHFDEYERIREIVSQKRAHLEQAITGNGHVLVMLAASSGMSSVAELSHSLRGLKGIKYVKHLDKTLEEQNNLVELSRQMETIHTRITESDVQHLLICNMENYQELVGRFQQIPSGGEPTQSGVPAFTYQPVLQKIRQCWIANTQVNFSSIAFPAVNIEHPDAPVFTVLGEFLKNGYLHRTIREQGGAYGGGASYDSNISAFKFYSYRDPRIIETLEDFFGSIEWLMSKNHEWRELEESILGIIGNIDKPRSPSGEAKDVFHNNLFGHTPEQRNKFRDSILGVTIDDLVRIGGKYLDRKNASMAVLTNDARSSELLDLDMEINYV